MFARLPGASFWPVLVASVLLGPVQVLGAQPRASEADPGQEESRQQVRQQVLESAPAGEQDSGPGRGPGPRGGFWQEPTPEQWERALGFLRQNAPRRLEVYERAFAEWREQNPTTQPSDLPRSIRGARARIYWRIRMLQALEERDPPLYELELRLFRLEDEIIGAMSDARRAREAGDEAGASAAADQARQAVQAYAQGVLEQREARIARLRQELAREEQRLEADRANIEQLVERLMERFRRSVPGEGDQRPREGESGEEKSPGG